jgi:transglutaminase-like putative cysteine protease
MKKSFLFLVFFIVFSLLVYSDDFSEVFYVSEVLSEVEMSSFAEISFLDSKSYVKSFKADLFFFPKPDDFLSVRSFSTDPDAFVFDDRISFKWNFPSQVLNFGYSAEVISRIQESKVSSKIRFPITKVPDTVKDYLRKTDIIDFDSKGIREKALELAGDSDDFFVVVAEIAFWIKNNVKYDLSSLTVKASQKASWVLSNKIGVCDEITSLFIAMLRSLGIPAKFVSGLAFTDSLDFQDGWGYHGWAEVYFPGYGWVPYDVTFGEFAWVDAGHIKMRESVDSKEPSSKFYWEGVGVDVKLSELKSDVRRISSGKRVSDDIFLDVKVAKEEIGPGSYNLIIAEVENLRDYYVAKELFVSKVAEMSIFSDFDGKKLVVLKPGEKKTFFWLFKVVDEIPAKFSYTVPVEVYSLKNESSSYFFRMEDGFQVFSKSEVEILKNFFVEDYFEGLDFFCELSSEIIFLDEFVKMDCEVLNNLDFFVKGEYCFDSCENFDLGKGEKKIFSNIYFFDKPGVFDLFFVLNTGGKSLRAVKKVSVFDIPEIKISSLNSGSVSYYGESFKVFFALEKASFSVPENVCVKVKIGVAEVFFDVGDLKNVQDFVVDANSASFKKKDQDIVVIVSFEDFSGNKFEVSDSFFVSLKKLSLWQRIKMFFSGIFR